MGYQGIGVIYMSPFWNHILAKKGRFIHVRSQISWYVCSMYLGTKGDFFSYTCTFCALLPRCCALLCGRPLSYVCTIQFLKLRIFYVEVRTACVCVWVLMTICRAQKQKKSFGSTPYRTLKNRRQKRCHEAQFTWSVKCKLFLFCIWIHMTYELIWDMNSYLSKVT